MEFKDHPWFVGVQFHPELKSTVENPHPLFVSYIRAALEEQARRKDPQRALDREKDCSRFLFCT